MECIEEWESLPKEILSIVLQKVLDREPSEPWPLSAVYRQATALSCVCKRWASVLFEHPPCLNICLSAAPHYVYDWMAQFQVESLLIGEGADPGATGFVSPLVSDPEYGPTYPAPCPPYFIFHQLLHLRNLELHLPLWEGAAPAASFQANELVYLTSLTRLVLSGFLEYDLTDLRQPSLRHLELSYGEKWLPDVLSSHSISIPRLPETICLDSLTIKKVGVVGLLLEEWDKVKNIHVDAMFVLVGVPVPNVDLVTHFERPYREGDYVPPHLLGDWDAVEASNRAADATADHLLSGIACCSRLECIRFTGECSTSVKLVPAVAGEGAVAVPWLHNITQQATLFLYGMSGAELLNRLIDMRRTEKLGSVALEIFLSDSTEQAFEVHVKRWAPSQG